jgi:mono/diheme cytochrome c family protein
MPATTSTAQGEAGAEPGSRTELPATRSRVARTAANAIRACALLLAVTVANAHAQGDAKRGEYLAKAGGCQACHSEEKKDAIPYAGGRALKTPFGTFYGPNITPHEKSGLGRWTEADFVRAMRLGVRPDGAHYFPAFPYPSFTRTSDGDLRDLWAFLRALPPSAQPSREHDVRFPFYWRVLIAIWKWLFFTPGPFVSDNTGTAQLNRGAYLVNALGHCGECHTPRNLLGGPKRNRFLAGGKAFDIKGGTPNLTSAELKKWSDKEFREYFLTGITPDFDSANETMAEVVRNTTSQLTPEDLAAVTAYLRALPTLPDE